VSPAALEEESRGRVDERLESAGFPEAASALEEAQVRELLANGLDEDDAVRLALGHQRRTRAALAKLGIGSGELAAATLLSNPVLHGQLLFLDRGPEIDLGISQSLVRTLLLPIQKARSAAELRALEAAVASEILAAVLDARRAHVRASHVWRDLELRRAAEASALGSQELMQDLVQAGNATPARAAANAVELARRSQDRMESERRWIEAREQLNRACGLAGELTQWELCPEALVRSLGGRIVDPELMEGLDLNQLESRAMTASLALAESRARAEAQAHAAGLSEWASRLQDAELGLAAKRESDDSSWGLGPSFRIPLPMLDTGDVQTHAARARLQVLLEEHEALLVDLFSRIREWSERLQASVAMERQAREVLLPAERALLEETLRNFNAMQIGAFDVLRVRAGEIEAERMHLAAYTDARLARLEVEALLQGHLPVSAALNASSQPRTSLNNSNSQGH
jgi:outer membrane protein TolC